MVLIAAAPLVMAVVGRSRSAWAADAAKNKSLDSIRKGGRSLLARDAKVSLSAEPLRKSQAEWKKTLSEPQFYVLREEGRSLPSFAKRSGGSTERKFLPRTVRVARR